MDTDALILRIEQLLRDSPSEATLRNVAGVLARARGGDDDAKQHGAAAAASSSSSSLLPDDEEDLLSSVGSSRSVASSRTASQRSTAASTAAAAAAAEARDADDGGEMGMSLPLGRTPDANHVRTLERHRARMEVLKKPVDVREKERRQYQALLEGRGGKHVHADIVQNGATQIGGMTSQTPSMWAGPETPMSQIASKMLAGGPPRIRNLPSDFKLA